MHPEIEELRPKLKEVLYDCAIDLHATKAALYLLDKSVRKFEMITEFGFRNGIRQWAGFNDPMVDRCSRGRSAFIVNSAGAEPRIAELLFDTSSVRLLSAPLFSRGELVGFMDVRDKQGKQPFEQKDAAKAQSIADRILKLVMAKNVWGQRFITVADTEPLPSAPSKPDAVPLTMPPVAAPPATISPIAAAAREATPRLLVAGPPETIGDAELAEARNVLRAILLLPGVMAAAFTEPVGQEIATKGPLTPDGAAKLNAHALHTNLQMPHGAILPKVGAAQMRKVYTSPVVAGKASGLYLTVAFSEKPHRPTQELMSVMLDHLQTSIEHSMQFSELTNIRLQIATKLVEPEFTSFPELRKHSEAVAMRSEGFARYLGLTGAEVETVKLTAMVHDVGMRLLDYERLYRKRNLSADEIEYLREHVSVGAAIVEPLLGPEIARAVLCHHERFDGAGYPNGLHGKEIPRISRILQICDVYVTITDPDGYTVPESHEAAIAVFSRGGDAQFDGELAMRFIQMMNES